MNRELRALPLQIFNKTCFGTTTSKLCLKAVDGNFAHLDHGAPIIHNRQLIGLHSKTVTTDEYGTVTVGTSISKYYDWIVDTCYLYKNYTATVHSFGKNLAMLHMEQLKKEKLEKEAQEREEAEAKEYAMGKKPVKHKTDTKEKKYPKEKKDANGAIAAKRKRKSF